jgi:hypothetical protein
MAEEEGKRKRRLRRMGEDGDKTKKEEYEGEDG